MVWLDFHTVIGLSVGKIERVVSLTSSKEDVAARSTRWAMYEGVLPIPRPGFLMAYVRSIAHAAYLVAKGKTSSETHHPRSDRALVSGHVHAGIPFVELATYAGVGHVYMSLRQFPVSYRPRIMSHLTTNLAIFKRHYYHYVMQ